ncbi:DUF4229 domain-containing protein [Clavibacter capsici]|uniref:DUF4229 domain-containing protein n=1 Tax=Clavibacter capsici TaxID=1874630 RepID=A0AAE6XTJ7_9MICO|nr:DUF4229 domain-containing protein [Clavibacter capsici]ALD13820.1 hypothetical protein AES38_13665 [Clavibacter capsici]QIS46052.1 DUF4229 domain-containing protein [Clavibacter capsici]
MSSRRYWLVYTVVRILLFAVPFGLVVAVSPDFWPLAAVIGAVVSFCGSYIFLRKQREAMAADLAAIAAGRKAPVEDDDSEDAAVDAAERRARAAGSADVATGSQGTPDAGTPDTAAAAPRVDGEAERS